MFESIYNAEGSEENSNGDVNLLYEMVQFHIFHRTNPSGRYLPPSEKNDTKRTKKLADFPYLGNAII